MFQILRLLPNWMHNAKESPKLVGMSQGDEFRISKSGADYRAELWRNNLFYVSFADALTKEAADRADATFNALRSHTEIVETVRRFSNIPIAA